MITFLRLRRSGPVSPGIAASRRREGTTALELTAPTPQDLAVALGAGLLPVGTNPEARGVAAWVVTTSGADEVVEAGVPAWMITLRYERPDERVLAALARSGARYLRSGRRDVAGAARLAALPGLTTTVSVFVDSVEDAITAVAAGAGDLLLRDWDTASIGELRDRLDGCLVERTALPVGLAVDEARAVLPAEVFTAWLGLTDGSGAARPRHEWAPGRDLPVPVDRGFSAEWSDSAWHPGRRPPTGGEVAAILQRSLDEIAPTQGEVERLFRSRGAEVEAVAETADELRRRRVGDTVTYVVNRNVNYTNQCYFRCGFCAFSKGPRSLALRGEPYLLETHEVAARAKEAWDAGATEVCLQGGIHPDFTGDFYVSVVEAVKRVTPGMHVHGFTPLEVWQGAETLGIGVPEFLARLRDVGLGTLPGTAAEILDDGVRRHLCPDKITTAQWCYVMEAAHGLGLRSTATMMFGHVDGPTSWAEHFEVLRRIQRRTGGFTEFVPLPFVHMGAPIFLRGKARPGPTWDEVVLVHAVGRVAFDGLIPNVQASWVKLGLDGAARLLGAGCNDLGGTLMGENISRAAGASHGQMVGAGELEATITAAGRVPARRSTLYEILQSAD